MCNSAVNESHLVGILASSHRRHNSIPVNIEYHAPSYKFIPVNIDELLRDGQNFIGHVVKVRDSDNIKS